MNEPGTGPEASGGASASPSGGGKDAGTGAGAPFFRSRWVRAPAHVSDLGAVAGLPGGFRAAGVAGGIKREGELDVGLLVCEAAHVTSAARFCDSGTPAAPVLLSQERCRLDALRVVAANSGNANAATGASGFDHAARVQATTAEVLGVGPEFVAVASTGVIGVPLPVERLLVGVRDAVAELRADGEEDFARAIMTTDAFQKRAALELRLPSGKVRMSAQCKGAGMISPRFATMLCFVQTDAALDQETADLMLGVCVKRSFDRITVDGQLSTNDTVVLQASGTSGVVVGPESEDELLFGEALDALLRQLALLIVADGEGALRIARVAVHGGHPQSVEAAARAVANSPLVKTALHGADPNWGRVVQAVGAALPGTAPLACDVEIEGVRVCTAGVAADHDAGALARAVAREEVDFLVGLPGEGAETELFFSDLSHEYVRINAEYTS